MIALLNVSGPAHAQEKSPSSPTDTSTSAQKYLSKSIDIETSDTGSLTNFAEQSSKKDINTSDSTTTWYMVKTLFVLVLMCGAIWALIKFLKKSGLSGASSEFMSIQSTLAVGQNQYLQIVQVGKQFFMIGVTDKSINLLGEITDSDTITDLKLTSKDDNSSSTSSNNNFGQLLQQFTGTSQHDFSSNDGSSPNEQESKLDEMKNKLDDMRQSGGNS